MITVVYPLIKAERDCEEFRYSLRSLEANMQEEFRVYVIGHKPYWCTGVEHIPYSDAGEKQQNKNIKALIASSLADEFLWVSDDMYIDEPVSIDELSKQYYLEVFSGIKKGRVKGFKAMLWRTYDKAKALGLHGLNYTTHTPVLFNSEKLRRAMVDFGAVENGLHLETLYLNHIGAEKDAIKIGSEKVGRYSNSEFRGAKDAIYLSFDDAGKGSGIFKYIKAKYKNKSRFEI